jgi:hypothetical protein
MTNKELIHKIIDLYVDARKSKFPMNNIVRDRSHTISGAVEDLFALYILELFDEKDKIKIFIDKGIQIKLNGKRKKIYPDIVVVKDKQIIGIIDMKMDLGWSRGTFHTICEKYGAYLVGLKNGASLEELGANVTLSPKLIYQVVVVSKLNITLQNLDDNLKLIESYNLKDRVSISFLTSNRHPNEGDTEAIKANITIHEDEFKVFSMNLKGE